jgi:soluble lytic murein transglycosylase-like protein
VGQPARAAAELWALWQARTEPALDRALMLVAARVGVDRLAVEIAATMQADRALPRARLRPRGGFTTDPAMIYALARAESNFDAALVSPAGALGLLQIKPETARFITQGRPALHNPAINLAVGQQYIAWLAALDGVSGDLIRLLASYNAGPAALARVSIEIHDAGDPLLFIEAMPIAETRLFIERVLTYTWLYAARLRLPAPSLDELAAGDWPRYHLLGPMQKSSSRLH